MLALCILVAFAIAGYVNWSGKSVQVGMTEAEVEEILGGPGLMSRFRNERELKNLAESMEMVAPAGATLKSWDRNQGAVLVVFDRDGNVASVRYPRGTGRIMNMLTHSIGMK